MLTWPRCRHGRKETIAQADQRWPRPCGVGSGIDQTHPLRLVDGDLPVRVAQVPGEI